MCHLSRLTKTVWNALEGLVELVFSVVRASCHSQITHFFAQTALLALLLAVKHIEHLLENLIGADFWIAQYYSFHQQDEWRR
jgi:hypothetical protein